MDKIPPDLHVDCFLGLLCHLSFFLLRVGHVVHKAVVGVVPGLLLNPLKELFLIEAFDNDKVEYLCAC